MDDKPDNQDFDRNPGPYGGAGGPYGGSGSQGTPGGQGSPPEQPKPQKQGRFRSSFGAALVGGAVVAVVGAVLLLTGAVKSSGGGTTTIERQTAAPIAATSGEGGGEGNTVDEIYKADGDGVAFIESRTRSHRKRKLQPLHRTGIAGRWHRHRLRHRDRRQGPHPHQQPRDRRRRAKSRSNSANPTTSTRAEVVGTDPASDLALLKVDAPTSELDPLTLGDSSAVEVGDPVVAIGNPFGLDRTVTSGIVSALQRQIQAPNGFSIDNVIQTDAAINPGNSGGPLINAQGEVIGINSQIETGGNGADGNVGIGFAIPINTAKGVIHELETKGSVEHAYLGISGGTMTPELAKAVNLPVEEGVLVQSVEKGGPADKAGLEGGATKATIDGAEIVLGGDIITELDGKKIAGMEQIIERGQRRQARARKSK